ncbi:hypothetical protein GCM10009430_29800 [Aquimarina litoralis]|uniref:Calx-beta domain-containing protein n=1 Tax=Aquimarina litoralis TaxID=584605 RepID=A0ABP3U5J9_9FLAO
MKLYNLKYILAIAVFGLLFTACEDDDPITAGIGDPLTKEVINLDATIASDITITGEGNVVDFTVTLPQSFNSAVTVTARATLDNGNFTTGTAEIDAGATTGTGSITLSPDDSVIDGSTIDGIADAVSIELIGILLDELVPDTTYTISSNVLSLGLYPDTLPAAGGLNILFDWDNPAVNDLDLEVIDRAFTSIFESSGTGSRFESDLFQTTGRADGIYDVYYTIFSASPTEDINFNVLFTLPDGRLTVVSGVIPAGSAASTRTPIATFEKSTDAVTGVTSYINIGNL